MASGLRVGQQSSSSKNLNEEKLSIGASCLVSSECFSMCCSPLPTGQVRSQVAACSIRDDGTHCIQSPDEWDNSVDLVALAGLSARVQQLKNNKIKKKIIISNASKIKFNTTKTTVKPATRRPTVSELAYPSQRPSVYTHPTTTPKDPLGSVYQTWAPSEPSYNKMSILSTQESLPVLKEKFQATINRQGTTPSPDLEIALSATEVDTGTLWQQLLSLNNQDFPTDSSGSLLLIAPAPTTPQPFFSLIGTTPGIFTFSSLKL